MKWERTIECETITRFNKYEVITLTFIKSSFGGVVSSRRLSRMDLKEERKATVNIDAFEKVWL